MTFLASIPSPSSGTIDLGPFTIHMYGLMLLLAIAGAVALTGYRWVKWGGDWDLVFRVAVWGVAAGIVGARLYHDITSWSEVPDEWWGPFAVWQGGLGVWGGIGLGVLVGAWIVHRSKQSVPLFMDAVAPGLLLAQGIGRWGNWFNQELFGKPTDLPWGLEIDPAHQPAGYFEGEGATYHPTFLYEFTYDIVGVIALLLIDKYFKIKRPGSVRALRRDLLLRPLLRGADPDRSGARVLRTAAERLRLDRAVRALGRVLHLLAVPAAADRQGAAEGTQDRANWAGDGRAEEPRPLRRLASGDARP